MRFNYFALVLVLLAVSAAAQDKKDATPQASTSVLINGQRIKGKVLEIDGKHFVAVEDLAQSLRGTIAYGDGQIALTLSKLPPAVEELPASQRSSLSSVTSASEPPSTPAQPLPSHSSSTAGEPSASQPPATTILPNEAGRVKGTLTYFFDFHVGNKPDSGSKVWLVKGKVEIPADQNFVGTSTAIGTSENPEEYNAINYSITDDHGNFDLLDVPPGQYTLVIQSAHTKGTLKEKKNFFGTGNGRNPRDSMGRVEFFNIVIKPGETIDASKDFGPNIDM